MVEEEEDGGGCCEGGAFVVVEEDCRHEDDGSDARIRMSRTRQSLPPLYDSESWSGLFKFAR